MSSLFDNGMVTILPTSKGLGRGPTIEARQDLNTTSRVPSLANDPASGIHGHAREGSLDDRPLMGASADNVTLGDLSSADADHVFLSFSLLYV